MSKAKDVITCEQCGHRLEIIHYEKPVIVCLYKQQYGDAGCLKYRIKTGGKDEKN